MPNFNTPMQSDNVKDMPLPRATSGGNWATGTYIPQEAINHYNANAPLLNLEQPESLSERAGKAAVYGVPGAVMAGVADIVASVSPLSFEDSKQFADWIGPNFGDYYRKNEDALRFAGDLAGSFAVIGGVTKLLNAPATMEFALSKLGTKGANIAKFILPNAANLEAKTQAYAERVSLLANKGQQAFTGNADPMLGGLAFDALKTSYFDAVKYNLTVDAALYATFNESDVLFPSDMTTMEKVAMYGIPSLAIFPAISALQTRYALKEITRGAGEAVSTALNPRNLPISERTYTPGARGPSIAIDSIMARDAKNAVQASEGDSILATNMNAQHQALRSQITDQTDKLGKDNIWGNGVTSAYKLQAAELKTAVDTFTNDPAVATHIVSLEQFTPTVSRDWHANLKRMRTGLEKERQALDEKLGAGKIADDDYAQQADAINKKLDDLTGAHALVLETDGSLTRLSQRRQHYGDNAADTASVSRLTQGDVRDTLYSIRSIGGKPSTHVMANSQMRLYLPSTAGEIRQLDGYANSRITAESWDKLSTTGRSSAYGALRESLDAWLKQPLEEKTKSGIVRLPDIRIGKNAHFSEIDAALEAIDATRNDAARLNHIMFDADYNIITPKVVRSTPENIQAFRDELELRSLVGKYDAFVKMTDKYSYSMSGPIKLKPEQVLTNDDYITGLNLPNDGLGGAHPLMQLFSDLYLSRVSNLQEALPTIQSVRRALQLKVDPTGQIAAEYLDDVVTRGSQLSLANRDKRPVLGVFRGSKTPVPKYMDIVTEVANNHARIMDRLATPNEKAPLISALMQRLREDPARWEMSRRPDLLVEGSQLRRDTIAQTMSTVENNPVIMAADSLSDSAVQKVVHAYAMEQFKPHIAKIDKMMAPGSEGDVASFATLVNARGQGWRLAKNGAVPVIDDSGNLVGVRYKLEDHAFNKEKWRNIYGEEMPQIAFLPAPRTGKTGTAASPLVSTPLASEVFESMASLSRNVGEHYNALRSAQGMKPMPLTEFHLPAKNLSDKEVAYLIDLDTGQIKTLVSGPSTSAVAEQVTREIENAKSKGINLFKASQDDMANYFDAQHEAFAGLIDFSSAGRQTGTSKGKSYGDLVEDGRESLKSMQTILLRQYENIGRQTTAVAFQPQLRWVAQAKATSGQGSRLTRGVETSPNVAKQTIWDIYQNRLLGLKSLRPDQSVGKQYYALESIIDAKLQKMWDKLNAFREGGKVTSRAAREFSDMESKLGDYTPFRDINDYVEHTLRIRTPPTLRRVMSDMNELTSIVGLRAFEVGLGLINILSLPAVIPAVTRGLARRPGQTLEDWKATNAAFSTPLTDDVTLWNPVRTMLSGTHFYWNGGAEKTRMLQDAAKRGHLRHEVAERMSLMTEPFQSYSEKHLRNFGKLISTFVDKTEEVSRTLAYTAFYNMGRKSMAMGHEASLEFAHHMANKTIGDFRPNNRPRIFQGAVGMPLSLFTTYMWNYYQRIFSHVETKNLKGVMAQVGWQSALFGTSSLPGWDFFIDNLTSNYDGSVNLVDRLQNSFGTGPTDFLLYGSLQTMSGMAVSQRADADIYLNAASFQMAGRVVNMLGDMASAIKTNEDIPASQIMEIMARGIPNRMTRNVMDLFAGYTTDGAGQIILDETRDWPTAITRLAGFKTVKEQKIIDEFSRERVTRLAHAEIMDNLRQMVRSAIRNGDFTPEKFERGLEMYTKAGGNPGSFNSYLQEQAMRSVVDKATLEAMDSVSSPDRQGDFMRLMQIIGDD